MPKTTRFDAADTLDSEARQVAYITAALETGNADFVRDALGLVARARGMGEIARNAGLNRAYRESRAPSPTLPRKRERGRAVLTAGGVIIIDRDYEDYH